MIRTETEQNNASIQDQKTIPSASPIPGQQPQCTTEKDGPFEFLHPKTTCDLVQCSHHYICKLYVSCAQKGAILPIPQSDSQSVPSNSVYSPSDFSDLDEGELQPGQYFYSADFPTVGTGTAHATCGTYWTKVCTGDHPPKELDEHIDHQKSLDGKYTQNGAYILRVKISCHRPLCPKCWPSWRKREVARTSERFDAYEEANFNRYDRRHMKRCHIGISVPKTLYHLPKKKMQQIALNHLKSLGIEGGSIIYHSKRQKNKIHGNWTPENTYYSPHFHAFTHLHNAYINGKAVAKIHQKTGWIIRNFGERPLQKSISYQLSHAGVPPKHGHIVTWFGTMNYRKLHVEKHPGTNNTCPWGHKLDHYGIHISKHDLKLPQIEGYQAMLPREGWLILPHKQKRIEEDPGPPGWYD